MALALVGLQDRQLQAAGEDEEFYRFVDVAAEVYNEINTKYVDEVESRKVLEGALSGMFSALDEHSQYMNPDMLKSLEKDTTGEFSGIGIHITKRQGVLTVIAPIPGTPAAEAGIQPWDRIIEIEGETTEGMSMTDAVDKLTGPAGTSVTFKVYREGEAEPLEFTLKRANVEVKSVHFTMFEDNIGYIRIARFSENTARDVRLALLDLKGKGMQGLLLDLRHDPGGLLREAIDVSDLFVEKGEMIVSTKGRLRSQNREYRAMTDPIINVPTFVLVNEGSASASEIVAGALQDHHLAVIIGPAGKNTFGKGSVQTIANLTHSMVDDEDGNPMTSALRLTTAKYYVPSGRTIPNVGITPDIGVPLTKKQELELIRHGMYGDVSTGEDFHVPDPAAEPAEGEAEEPETGAPKLQLQREEDLKLKEDSDSPFYDVKKPELVEKDDFVDVLLDEAKKQMKIYMILQKGTNGETVPTIASSPGAEGISLNNEAE
ncbi:S41 family peptidase [Candidatus Poribacteria bacterium]|nr:S41 family peptidase [Candidatus Poribacteria bacterium]